MNYSSIIEVSPQFHRSVRMKPLFMPFELLAVSDLDGGEKREVWIYPPAFRHDWQVKAFLRHFYRERPDLFPEIVVEFINSDGPL